jgi:hypothetical protein
MSVSWKNVDQIVRRDDALIVRLSQDTWLNYIQLTQWFSVFLSGPTKTISTTIHSQGNDFPGAYYYDRISQTETILWVSGPKNWRKMRFEVRVEDDQTYFGLFASTAEPLPPGLVLQALQRPRQTVPDPWEALQILMDISFQFWPLPPMAETAPDWDAIARQTFDDLLKPICQITVNGVRGYNAYALTGEKRGSPQPYLELFVQLDLALSLARYSRLTGDPAFIAEADYLRGLINYFYLPDEAMLDNHYPPRNFGDFGSWLEENSVNPGDPWPGPRPGQHRRRVQNSWYAFHNLHKALEIAWMSGDRELSEIGLRCVETGRRFAHAHKYLFPLFGDWANMEPCGAGLDVYVAGLYATCLVYAARLDPIQRNDYYADAVQALEVARRIPPGIYLHEPIDLACAVFACDAIARDSGGERCRAWRDDYLRLLLMMLYREPPLTGMFQACGAMLYPAFKENVEVLLPLTDIIDDAPSQLPLRQIIEHQLRNNLVFFDEREPRHIPFEDIPTTELPGLRGELGKEVYGSGQVFDLAFIQNILKEK